MAEVEFERRLERLFAEGAELADSEAFVARVERRLDRGWTMRRVLIGVAGVAGGVVGASQLVMSNFSERLQGASEGPGRLLAEGLEELAPSAGWLAELSGAGHVIWLAAGLAGLAVALMLTRLIEEI